MCVCVCVCVCLSLHLWEFPSPCLSLSPAPPVGHVPLNQSESGGFASPFAATLEVSSAVTGSHLTHTRVTFPGSYAACQGPRDEILLVLAYPLTRTQHFCKVMQKLSTQVERGILQYCSRREMLGLKRLCNWVQSDSLIPPSPMSLPTVFTHTAVSC